MGLCVPKQCSVEQVQAAFAPLMTEYATNSGWSDVQVAIEPSGYYTKEVARSVSKNKAIGLGFLGLLFIVVVAATTVQVSSIGDKSDS
jgi:anti-sigma-K factor RskA